MLALIESLLRNECRIRPGDGLVVGVSGGADSQCLLHALRALGHRPIVAHFDHQLRPESIADVARVAALASSMGLPFVAGTGNVEAHSTSNGMSIEAAGRALRYAFLFDQARAHATAAVVVGHTADDQAETILMHLLRGTSLLGLRGMGFRVLLEEFDPAIPIVRPLLGIWRHQTLEYCRQNDLAPLDDASNTSREFLRNRIRLDLIPALETYNPQIRQALWRLGHSTGADVDLLDELAGAALTRILTSQGPGYVSVDAAQFASEPLAMQSRMLIRAARILLPTAEVEFDDLRRAQAFVSDRSSRRLQLSGGLWLRRELQSIYMTVEEPFLPAEQWPQLTGESIKLRAGGEVFAQLADGWWFTAELSAVAADPAESASDADPYRGRLDLDALPTEFELRTPITGDRIQPLGLNGHTQKLSDVFINIRVPERLRRCWPVLATPNEVIWVPGFRIAEPYRISRHTRRAVLVAVYRSDGSAPIPEPQQNLGQAKRSPPVA